MFRIKLLIFLPISFLIFSCVQNHEKQNSLNYDIDYIGGEYDGVNLKNILFNYLKSFKIYDDNSDLIIQSKISHKNRLFVTNIDNTSDREEISTSINFRVFDQKNNCPIYYEKYETSQFYVFASSEKFLSNKLAVKKIKTDNTETLIKKFINKLFFLDRKCIE
tara:strand:- start:205 stop:693 length:489 start_codon:yes stop_codon:yes gene_type:complete